MTDFPTSNSTTRRPARSTVAGFTVAVVVVVLWSIVNTVQRLITPASGDAAEHLSYRIGQDIGGAIGGGLVAAGIVSLVLYFGYVRSRAPGRGGKHFLILWAIGTAIGLAPVLIGLTFLIT